MSVIQSSPPEPWSRCQYCRSTLFRLDLTFTHGQYMRYHCRNCKGELRISPDLKLNKSLSGGMNAHIDWVIMPPLKDQPRPPAPHLADAVGLLTDLKMRMDDSNLAAVAQLNILRQLIDDLENGGDTEEMAPHDTAH